MINRYQELANAATIEEVVEVTRRYLSGWARADLEALPAGCRPEDVQGPHDIEAWADRLAEATRSASYCLDGERRLDRITSHFLIAAVRIRRLPSARLAALARLAA